MNNADIAIVTDSTADLPPELIAQHQIHVIPNVMVIDGQSLEDGKGISRKEFYDRLPGISSVSTATASSGAYQELYEKLLQAGAKSIISIHPSSLLSGIYNAASVAAQAFDKRVWVVDSRSITLGLGFQVLEAAEALQHGASLEGVVQMLENLQLRSRVIAMLDTLEYVHRSGRVSWARARLGNLLQFKPFVDVRDGQVDSLGEARTRRKGIERLQEYLLKQGPIKRLGILHTNAEADARQFLENLPIELPTVPLIVNITTIIGVHVGPNGLGFAALLQG